MNVSQVLQGQGAQGRDLRDRRHWQRDVRLRQLRGEVPVVVHAHLPAERHKYDDRLMVS